MEVLKVEHLTKDYGNKRGIFDVSFSVAKGEALGFLGPNGAGKTTTIRHIMGFIQPQQGATTVMSMNSWLQSADIQNYLGYLPGEIAFPLDMTGDQYIRTMGKLRKMKDYSKSLELIDTFELDTSPKMKRMSKGTKQKLGIVTAFMHDPQIFVLDEPTSGLDPLMQNRFMDLVLKEKADGKTILLSSHLFEEVQNTCDRIIIIKEGNIVANINEEDLASRKVKKYCVVFEKEADKERFLHCNFEPCDTPNGVEVAVKGHELNDFIALLNQYRLLSFSEVQHNLEDYFMTFYGGDSHE